MAYAHAPLTGPTVLDNCIRLHTDVHFSPFHNCFDVSQLTWRYGGDGDPSLEDLGEGAETEALDAAEVAAAEKGGVGGPTSGFVSTVEAPIAPLIVALIFSFNFFNLISY